MTAPDFAAAASLTELELRAIERGEADMPARVTEVLADRLGTHPAIILAQILGSVEKLTPTPAGVARTVEASATDGLRLMRAFLAIADQAKREQAIELVERLART